MRTLSEALSTKLLKLSLPDDVSVAVDIDAVDLG